MAAWKPCVRRSGPCSRRASRHCPNLRRSRMRRRVCRNSCRPTVAHCRSTPSSAPAENRMRRPSSFPASWRMPRSRPRAKGRAGAAPSRSRRRRRYAHWVYMNKDSASGAGSDPATFRAGFAALVGRPNVGKSTLLNALVGEKLSIVTSRPQTTRHRVLGMLNRPGVQIAFVDTPGLHLGEKRALNRAMNRTAASALADADLVVFVVEALRLGQEDHAVLQRIRESGRESIAVISKVDNVYPKDKLLPFVAELSARHAFLDIVPVSAQTGVNVERLI